MSLPVGTTWEVRATGNDANGGGFVAGSSGTDYSQQATAQYFFIDLASSNATTNPPQVTSANHSFVSADVGNIMHINGGTNFTAGFYQIVSVSGGAATLDRACGTSASASGGNYHIGGALATPGMAGAAISSPGNALGHNVWIQYSGSPYTMTTATANVSGGAFAPTSTALYNYGVQVRGYYSSRWTGNPTANDILNRPTIKNGAFSSVNMVDTAAGYYNSSSEVSCIIGDCNSQSSTTAFYVPNGLVRYCLAKNFTVYGFCKGDHFFCEASGGSSAIAFIYSGLCYQCYAHGNSGGTAFQSYRCVDCVASGNQVGFNDYLSDFYNYVRCVAYNNSSHGFYFSGGVTGLILDCTSYGNGGYGYHAFGTPVVPIVLANCYAGSNTSGANGNTTWIVGSITNLTGDPSVGGGSGNFNLNSTAGAGAVLQGAGTTGFPSSSTSDYFDAWPVNRTVVPPTPAPFNGSLFISPQ